MTVNQLREFKQKTPFRKFVIHLSDGKSFEIDDPESLVIHKDWTTDAIVLMPRGQFKFIYLKNVTHVSSEGNLPRFKRRRRQDEGDSN